MNDQHSTRRCHQERGFSTVTAMFAFVVMLVAILSATHVLLNLQRRSIVRALAIESVTRSARVGGDREKEENILSAHGINAKITTDGNDAKLVGKASGYRIFNVGVLAKLSEIRVTVRSRLEGT